LLDFFLRRVRGPLDADVPEIVQTGLDGAVAASERCKQLFLQPREGG
jgi:hypothetical protein